MNNEIKIYDCLIIGAGPAGLTAAIYCQRAGLKTAFIERDTPGGKMVKTAIIENYPGFEEIKGFEISSKMLNQAIKNGSDFIYANIISIKKENNFFILLDFNNKEYKSKTVIIATGMEEKKLNVPGENEFFHKGISYCAICDGSLFKQKDVAIIGGGNSAFEEAIYLSNIVNKIYLIHRNEKFKADLITINKVKEIKNIHIITNTIVESFNGSDKLESISLLNVLTKEKRNINIDGSFIYIGFNPISNFINEDLINKEDNFVITNNEMETKTAGLFSIGDVNKKKYRQISTAINDGTIAALNVKKYLDNNF